MDSVVRGYRVQPLAAILAAEFRDRRYRADLASLVGDRGHEETERWIDELTLAQLSVKCAGALFAKKSVGAVFGLVLESGEPAVLKLFNRSYSLAELRAMHRCLAVAAEHGYPVPRARSPVFDAGDGVSGAIYAYMDGEQRDAHEPSVRRELARRLAELNELLAPLAANELPPSPAALETLWPAAQRVWERHDLNNDDTRFIDAHGKTAQLVLKKSKLKLVATHLDWGVKNIRFRDDSVCAVYDSDSLHSASEAESAGRAAAQFTAQWEHPVMLTPSPEEAQAFLEEYQSASGRRFSRAERAVAASAAHYVVAQVARQELLSGVPEADNFRGLLRHYDSQPLLDS